MHHLKNEFLFKLREIVLSAAIILFGLGQLGRLEFFNIDAPIYLYEIFLALFLFLFIIKRFKVKFNKLIISGFIFINFLGISLIFSLHKYPATHSIEAILYFLRLITYVILICLSSSSFKQFKNSRSIKLSFLISLVFIITTSIIQFLFFPKVGILSYLGWDPHMYRVIGLFFDPPITVSVYAIIAIIFLSLKNISNYFKYGVTFILLLLSILTYSRGGFVAIILTSIIFLILKKRFKYIILIFITCLIIFPLISSNHLESLNLLRTMSIESRIKNNKEGLSFFYKNPIIGLGYNQIKSEKIKSRPELYLKNLNSNSIASFHSSFINILVTGGVLGLFFFIIFLISLTKISLIHFYAVVFSSIISLFDNVLLHPFVLFLFFCLAYFNKEKAKNQ
jgi:hypothetical protein